MGWLPTEKGETTLLNRLTTTPILYRVAEAVLYQTVYRCSGLVQIRTQSPILDMQYVPQVMPDRHNTFTGLKLDFF
jgi:hypothetical protein